MFSQVYRYPIEAKKKFPQVYRYPMEAKKSIRGAIGIRWSHLLKLKRFNITFNF